MDSRHSDGLVDRVFTIGENPRDWRLDFWRGFAILMIFVNHVDQNWLTLLTTRSWGFSDAAELFVFLAGLSFARAVADRYRDHGALALSYAASRAARLYAYHIILVLDLAVVCAAYLAFTGSEAMIDEMQFSALFHEPAAVLRGLVILTYLPAFADVLPLYIALMIFGGVMVATLRSNWIAYAILSVSVYAVAKVTGVNFPAASDGRQWFFNPFCWQLLFTTGLLVWAYRGRSGFVAALHARTAIGVSVVMVVLGVVYEAPWSTGEFIPAWAFYTDFVTPLLDKQNLSLLRYAHFLAIAHLGYLLLRRSSPLQNTLPFQILRDIGANSLQAFTLATVLSTIARAYLAYAGRTESLALLVCVLGIVIIMVFAVCLSRAKRLIRLQKAAIAD